MLAFLNYQRFLGLTDLHFSKSLQRYERHPTWCTFFAHLLVLSLIVCNLIEVFIKKNLDYMGIQSRMDKMFFHLVNVISPLTELMVNLWLRITIETQGALLNRLRDLSIRLQLDTLALSLPHWLFRLYICLCIVHLSLLSQYCITNWNLYPYQHIFTIVGYLLHLVRTNYFITYYSSLVYIVRRLLRAQADQLKIMLRNRQISPKELRDCLGIHDELLLLCQEEMTYVFGVVLIFSYLNFTLNATSVAYVSTLEDRFSRIEVIFVLTWMSPICLYMIMPLMINEVAKEVRSK